MIEVPIILIKILVECWWTDTHYDMPEDITLETVRHPEMQYFIKALQDKGYEFDFQTGLFTDLN